MATINAWLKEAILLQDAIVKAYSNHRSDSGLRKTWEFVFGIEFNKDNEVDKDDEFTKELWCIIESEYAS
jgi:hypothetical protein